MRTLHIIIIILLLIIAFFAGLLFNRFALTGQATKEIEFGGSVTKALCNSNNECVDVLIEFKGENIISFEPLSETVKFPSTWKDPRNQDTQNL